ncbi:pseudouridine synthase [Pseudidiomarina taiwanensis]|uniref:Dual-specificity RNA pseudouridine synthase RluA n=1 Tax=Pseudidiomarina taiwanensis TaxID=337250 RepID=A0A432ZCI3_9GAMM|nr:pseudouridine synthase [Pseudidiomarina taiwanensis]RUO75600.1 RNA pseudouridine synthase [Pseudidiomarina taiwanensis]
MTLLTYQPPLDPYLDILHQDEAIIVANKPPGLLSVPGKDPAHYDALSSRLARVWPSTRIIHRLDMATSGLLVFALYKSAQAHLQRQFERRQVHKRYRALVAGQLPARAGTIELPLRCDWPNRPRQMVDLSLGKFACTHYQTVQVQTVAGAVQTEVLLTPYTGRSHQLRVHMQSLGTPILGDKFYAHPAAFAASSRLCLHAEELGFYHPETEQWLSFNLPAAF